MNTQHFFFTPVTDTYVVYHFLYLTMMQRYNTQSLKKYWNKVGLFVAEGWMSIQIDMHRAQGGYRARQSLVGLGSVSEFLNSNPPLSSPYNELRTYS